MESHTKSQAVIGVSRVFQARQRLCLRQERLGRPEFALKVREVDMEKEREAVLQLLVDLCER
jgi:hypothetical protein